MKKIILAALLGIALIVLPVSLARAATFKTDENSGNVVVNESAKNLYSAGNSVSINTKVLGDAVAAGNSVTVTGNVEHSLFAAGNSVTVKNDVGQNARVAGNSVVIAGNIGEDLLAAGNSLAIDAKSKIGGDALIGGAALTIDGLISGNLTAAAGRIDINGTVKGNVDIKNVEELNVGDKAVIDGKLIYHANKEANIAPTAKIASVEFVRLTRYDNALTRVLMTEILTLAMFLDLIGSLILLLVLIYFLPKATRAVVDKIYAQPWATLGIGFLALVATPIVAILLLISSVGTPVGIIVGLGYVLTLILAGNFGTILIGNFTRKLLNKAKDQITLGWQDALIGGVLAIALTFVPIAGGLLLFAAFLMALGAITKMAIGLRKKA